MSDKELICQFIDALAKETVKKLRSWKHLSRNRAENEKNQIIFETVFWEDEWHRILYDDSFQLPFEKGYFFLVHEWNESARDGTITDEFNLYIQSDVGTEPVMVANDTPEVYRLRNAIGDLKADILPESIKSVIESFLAV